MIKTGRINVYPAEIEAVLAMYPGVSEIAVVGVPDERWGEKVVACVIPRGECQAEDLIAFCTDKLAGFK